MKELNIYAVLNKEYLPCNSYTYLSI